MLSTTHSLISHTIYNIILSKLKIHLDYKSFRYGSIAPDLYPSMLFMSHTKNESISLVNKSICALSSGIFPYKRKEIQKFSFELGVIVHFLCDYFCTAHNEEKYNNMLLHYTYERKLKKFFDKNIMRLSTKSETEDWNIGETLYEFIDKKHEQYKEMRHSMRNDIIFSLGVSTVVALNIVLQSSENAKDRIRDRCENLIPVVNAS